jgi:hypothetical protein
MYHGSNGMRVITGKTKGIDEAVWLKQLKGIEKV